MKAAVNNIEFKQKISNTERRQRIQTYYHISTKENIKISIL